MDTIFCMDIGSNSVRLAKIHNKKTVYKKSVITRTAQNLKQSGLLSAQAINRTLKAVKNFAKEAQSENAPLYIFGTEALRKAGNAKEFCALVKKHTGTDIDILSPEEEALAGFKGAVNVLKYADYAQNTYDGVIVTDIGGASTEIICADGGDIKYLTSLPIGVVTLYNECKRNKTMLQNAVRRHLHTLPSDMQGVCVCTGGTATSLAAIDLGLEIYDANKVNGHVMSYDTLKNLTDKLFDMPIARIKKLKGLQKGRHNTISAGAYILCSILEHINKYAVIISDCDNIEGYCAIKGLI